jgi:hypothetical protein
MSDRTVRIVLIVVVVVVVITLLFSYAGPRY